MKLKKQIKKILKTILRKYGEDPTNSDYFDNGICCAVEVAVENYYPNLASRDVEYCIQQYLRDNYIFQQGSFLYEPGKWKKRIKIVRKMLRRLENGKWKPKQTLDLRGY